MKDEDWSATCKNKPQIALLMVKTNTSEVVNPFCSMPSIPPHANGVDFMHGLTLERALPSKPSLVVEISKLCLSMSSVFLGPNGLDSTCNQDIKIFNKLMETMNLRVNPSRDGVFDAEQTTRCNHSIQFKSMEREKGMLTFENGTQGLNTP